jgi:hypothetical protein
MNITRLVVKITNLMKKTSTQVLVPKLPQIRQTLRQDVGQFLHEDYSLKRRMAF